MTKVAFTLSAKEHKQLLKPLFGIINSNTVLPILDCVKIEQNGRLRIAATDLDTYMEVSMETKERSEFGICITGETLSQCLSNAIEDEISITGNEQDVHIKNEGFHLKTACELMSNYPKEPELGAFKEIDISGEELLPIIKNALMFVSNDDLRPAMTGICLTDYNGHIHIVATDAHRLYWKSIIKTTTQLRGLSVIITAKAARAVLASFKSSHQIKISIYDNHVAFTSQLPDEIFMRPKEIKIIGRKIDARYPDFTVVIPHYEFSFVLKRKQLLTFLKMAMPFLNPSTNQVNFDISNMDVKFYSEDVDRQNQIDYTMPLYVPSTSNFEKYGMAVNAKMLYQILQLTKADDNVKIMHNRKPTNAISVDDCVILMPLMRNT